MDGTVYIFINKIRNKAKLLHWQSGGFVWYYKRLESGTFELPSYEDTVGSLRLNYSQLILLIDGIAITNITRKIGMKKCIGVFFFAKVLLFSLYDDLPRATCSTRPNKENNFLKEQLAQLFKLINGFKSEKFLQEIDVDQLSLFAEGTTMEAEQVPKETITYTRDKKIHAGRNALPEHLSVREVVIELEEDTTGLKKIGKEVTKTLEYTPASLVKKRTIRPKYARKNYRVVARMHTFMLRLKYSKIGTFTIHKNPDNY